VSPKRLQPQERKLRPYAEWPASDRAAWENLFLEGDLLNDHTGTALHWREATRKTNLKHYARWLGWCAAQGRLDAACLDGNYAPWERATPAAVEAYARALLAEMGPRTVATSLIGLKCILQRMAPEADWSWLRRMTSRLDRWATPSRVQRRPEQAAPELFAIARGELKRLSRIPAPKGRERQAYRDVLLVAFLLACPIRERNLAIVELGRHLVRVSGDWHLRFEPEETKTGQALHLVVPAALTPYLDDYMARIRPAFPGAATHAHVWPAQKGRPMAEETIYASVMATSKRLFGTALNPHAFRSLAATLLAESSPEDALHARLLLGHRQPETTEKYYIRASQLQAARKVAEALQAIRDAQPERLDVEFEEAE
jgi:integrase